jgi:hypothetical protein
VNARTGTGTGVPAPHRAAGRTRAVTRTVRTAAVPLFLRTRMRAAEADGAAPHLAAPRPWRRRRWSRSPASAAPHTAARRAGAEGRGAEWVEWVEWWHALALSAVLAPGATVGRRWRRQ